MADEFDKIDKLLSMVPLRGLVCPSCHQRDADGFRIFYVMEYSAPVDWDGPARIMTADYGFEQFERSISDPRVFCDSCGHEFPIPVDWQLRSRQKDNYERPGRTPSKIPKAVARSIDEAQRLENERLQFANQEIAKQYPELSKKKR